MKKIRLIELFAGYGSQALAMKYLGINFESWKICEWAVKSIQAYKDMHHAEDNTDYSFLIEKEDLIEILFKRGISANYNEPMTREQIKRMGEEKIRTVYNNCIATKNLVNIQKTHGKDLEIVDTENYEYMITYSFPCQDLSLAGKGAGMDKGAGTRSGMLWEVERILKELNKLGTLPEILLMENVPQVHGTKNRENFDKWCEFLESIGYKNYWKDLNAKDYGVPQNRNRTFMVSTRKEHEIEMPEKKELKTRLKDLLEDEVDEKYYLSEAMIAYCTDMTDRNGFVRGARFRPIDTDKQDNLKTQLCNELIASGKVEENGMIRHSYSTNRMNNFYKQNSVNNNISPTLDTRCDCLGVCVKTNNKRQQELASKIDTTKDGQFLDFYNQSVNEECRGAITTRVDASNCTAVYNNLRIRKLTPKECFRLMGVKDADFERVAENQSNASLYHLAGDSIVVDVLMAIFKNVVHDEL